MLRHADIAISTTTRPGRYKRLRWAVVHGSASDDPRVWVRRPLGDFVEPIVPAVVVVGGQQGAMRDALCIMINEIATIDRVLSELASWLNETQFLVKTAAFAFRLTPSR